MAEACHVCGETVDEANSATCNGCGRRYHLNLRRDRPGKDCGDVWVNDDFLALEFGCFVCLGRAAPTSSGPAVGGQQQGEPPSAR